MQVSSREAQHIAFGELGPLHTAKCCSEGWVLKTSKSSSRMGEKVRRLLSKHITEALLGTNG